MTASSYRLDQKTAEDDAICERLAALGPIMRERAIEWARINTGSWNRAGLDTLAPQLAAAFEQLDADVKLIPADPFDMVSDTGKVESFTPGPILRITSRPEAPVQVIMSGHYDTVFPAGTFETITAIDDDR
ncbi:MAG: hypothetical protein ACPIE8_09680, partial [Henriciella sp.]